MNAATHNLEYLKTVVAHRRVKRGVRLPPPVSMVVEEREYFRDIFRLMTVLHEETKKVLPKLDLIAATRHDALRADTWTDEIDHIFKTLRYASRRASLLASDLARMTAEGVNTKNRQNFLRQMRAALGVDVFANAPRVASTAALFVQNNVSLITSIPERYLNEVESLVLTNFQQGRRVGDFYDDIEDRYKVSESRAVLIARDQVSKLNGALTQNRQTNLGISRYIWRTSQDERVRGNPGGKYPDAEPSHFAREGQIYEWKNPPENGHPGEDIQCRCHAEPYVDDVLGPDTGDEE